MLDRQRTLLRETAENLEEVTVRNSILCTLRTEEKQIWEPWQKLRHSKQAGEKSFLRLKSGGMEFRLRSIRDVV